MASSELATGAGLQVGLEGSGLGGGAEGDRCFDAPGPELRCMWDFTGVVLGEARSEVRRAACVVARRVGHADQDVDVVKRGTLIEIGWHAKPETRSGSRSPSSRSRVAQPTTTGQPSLSLRCERRLVEGMGVEPTTS